MKKERKVERYNYSKYSQNVWESPEEDLMEYDYWGIHPRNGHIHVDIKRFIKKCNEIYAEEYVYEGMNTNRDTPYLIPKKVHRCDYRINVFRDFLSELKSDWFNEYKPVLNKIVTPNEVYEKSRTSMLCCSGNSEDYDEIDLEARMDSFRRIAKYNQVFRSVYCQFIQKIATEMERLILIFMRQNGCMRQKFSAEIFDSFTAGLLKDNKKDKLRNFDNYKEYDRLRRINNFLKHNSYEAYKKIKNNYPENIIGSNFQYESGMFAGDWIKIEDDYIDKLFDKLLVFFEDYCNKCFNEDIDEAKWNYEDFFKNAFQDLKYRRNYN